MDKVIIKDLLVRGIIGINDWERKRAQDILINIVLFTDTHRAAETDSIADCVKLPANNVESVFDHVDLEMESRSWEKCLIRGTGFQPVIAA